MEGGLFHFALVLLCLGIAPTPTCGMTIPPTLDHASILAAAPPAPAAAAPMPPPSLGGDSSNLEYTVDAYKVIITAKNTTQQLNFHVSWVYQVSKGTKRTGLKSVGTNAPSVAFVRSNGKSLPFQVTHEQGVYWIKFSDLETKSNLIPVEMSFTQFYGLEGSVQDGNSYTASWVRYWKPAVANVTYSFVFPKGFVPQKIVFMGKQMVDANQTHVTQSFAHLPSHAYRLRVWPGFSNVQEGDGGDGPKSAWDWLKLVILVPIVGCIFCGSWMCRAVGLSGSGSKHFHNSGCSGGGCGGGGCGGGGCGGGCGG